MSFTIHAKTLNYSAAICEAISAQLGLAHRHIDLYFDYNSILVNVFADATRGAHEHLTHRGTVDRASGECVIQEVL